MTRRFTAAIEKDAASGLYVGIVPGLPGAHTQAASLDELNNNLQEVVELCLQELPASSIRQLPEVVGTLLIEVHK